MAILLTCMDLLLIVHSQDNSAKQIVHHLAGCSSALVCWRPYGGEVSSRKQAM